MCPTDDSQLELAPRVEREKLTRRRQDTYQPLYAGPSAPPTFVAGDQVFAVNYQQSNKGARFKVALAHVSAVTRDVFWVKKHYGFISFTRRN